MAKIIKIFCEILHNYIKMICFFAKNLDFRFFSAKVAQIFVVYSICEGVCDGGKQS